ncbi:hypothetical protein DV736_g4297, partial [Chaetothyriales sp. CBS 134916]
MGLDDWFLASSALVTIIQSAVVLYGCSQGLGATISDKSSRELIATQKVYYASSLLSSLALGFSKISIAILLRRINNIAGRERVFTGAAVFVAGWTIASILALALQCDLRHPWITIDQHCPGAFLRWKVICALDIISELLLFASAVYLVLPIQAPWSTKVTLVSGFGFRIPIISAIVCRLVTFDPAALTYNPSNREALFIVWTQTELNYSVITATIPGLLQFMRDLNTNFGGLTEQENLAYGKSQNSNGSYPLSTLQSVDKDTVNLTVSWGVSQEDGATNTYKSRALAADDAEAISKDGIGSNM